MSPHWLREKTSQCCVSVAVFTTLKGFRWCPKCQCGGGQGNLLHVMIVAMELCRTLYLSLFWSFHWRAFLPTANTRVTTLELFSVTPLEASNGFNISIFLTSCQHAFVRGRDSERRALEGHRTRVCYFNLMVRLKDGLTLWPSSGASVDP